MSQDDPVRVESLRYAYGDREALRGLDFAVPRGAIFGLLGPNGGGKTTLFRILSTLVPPSAGRALICGHDTRREADAVRRSIGVVFQSPALDTRLTVRENLVVQGHLYGLSGGALAARVDEMLQRVGLAARARDRAGALSGGLMRRVEIAKGLLHRPPLLLMDEPSTGLDPGARQDLWDLLRELRRADGATVLLTTHLMEEAERCDRLAILHEGSLVGIGTPAELKREIGGDVIVITTDHPEEIRDGLLRRFGVSAQILDGTVRLERAAAHELVPRIVEAFGERIASVTLGHPTLLDVFIRRTGRRFAAERAA